MCIFAEERFVVNAYCLCMSYHGNGHIFANSNQVILSFDLKLKLKKKVPKLKSALFITFVKIKESSQKTSLTH